MSLTDADARNLIKLEDIVGLHVENFLGTSNKEHSGAIIRGMTQSTLQNQFKVAVQRSIRINL